MFFKLTMVPFLTGTGGREVDCAALGSPKGKRGRYGVKPIGGSNPPPCPHFFQFHFFIFFIDWFIFNFNKGRSDTPFKKGGESRSGNRT